MKSKKIFKTFILFVLLALLILFVTISLFRFHRDISGQLQHTSIQSISEAQELYANIIKTTFAGQFNMLEGQARYFADIDFSNDSALKKTITATKGIGDFKKIAIVNKNGMCTSHTGQTLPNIYNKQYFQDALKTGTMQISNKIEMDESLEPILTLVYPIKHDGTVKAAVMGTLSYAVLKDLFTVSLFDGRSYFYIIAEDGNIILCNKDKKKTLYNIDFYEYLKNNAVNSSTEFNEMRVGIINDQNGYCMYTAKDGEKKILTYAPLDINGWNIISVIPFSYISQQQQQINFTVFRMLGIVFFTLAVFLFLVYWLFRRNSSIEKDNERLTIATNQAQSLIFEYNIARQTVEFSGDTQFILNTDRKDFSLDFLRGAYYKRIHADDSNIMNHLRNSMAKKESDFTAEFRYLCNDTYIWLRMTSTLMLNENGEPQKLIGSIVNVNDQMMHEQELRSIAEMDKLTDLLNKITMEQRCKAYFDTKPTHSSALFIIDLDNFKQVNDRLGHMIGDRAIIDAAKKISLVFSEKDYISRFGGDEFCILLRFGEDFPEESRHKVIEEKAQNLCTMLKAQYYNETFSVDITASIGISVYPENGTTYDELFSNADKALYVVKERGKNGHKIYSEL